MRGARWLFLILIVVASSAASAQTDNAPPYLYYYSRLFGGIIVERADGSDSRLIGADVIPPGTSGIGGPGWSPSGNYFAAYGASSGDGNGRPYVIDTQGIEVVPWMHTTRSTWLMQWSPTEEDILLVVASQGAWRRDIFFWVLDIEHNRLLSEFGMNLGGLTTDVDDIVWDMPKQRITFYVNPSEYDYERQYRVIMQFDGTTSREPVTSEEYTEHDMPYIVEERDFYDDYEMSPSGLYEVNGWRPALLTNLNTNEAVALPQHTQATSTCRKYLWSADEQHLLTIGGTLVSGGGCSDAVMGVTDSSGALWRELGRCSWDYPPCAGWLPEQVNVDAMPPGSDEPVQLDPVRIEYEDEPVFVMGIAVEVTSELRCAERSSNGAAEIVNIQTEEKQYALTGVTCMDGLVEYGLPILTAYDPVHDLLATFDSAGNYSGVDIWTWDGEGYRRVLPLDTQGFDLEFTEDGEYLRARNVIGWKVYAVEDILAAIDRQQ